MSTTERVQPPHALPPAEALTDPDTTAGTARPLGAQLLGWTFAQTLRAMCATWRMDMREVERFDKSPTAREPHIASFWHRKYVALCPVLGGRRSCVVTTASPHGHVVASICRNFGNRVIQIPPTSQGADALRMIGHAFAQAHAASIVADGPAGPYHKVKRGPIQVASETGHVIVPVSVAARRRHVMRHRWDRLEIPFLFTRVHVSVGEPLRIPPNLTWEEVQHWRARLHDTLEALDEDAERKVHAR